MSNLEIIQLPGCGWHQQWFKGHCHHYEFDQVTGFSDKTHNSFVAGLPHIMTIDLEFFN